MSPNSLLALRASDGATVTLERYPILLGRSIPGGIVPDVDVSHLDPTEAVDSRHVELIRDLSGVEVHDLGGASGTWVDGRRLPAGGRALLQVGGSLRVAGVFLTLIEVSGTVPPPPPSASRLADQGAATPWLENGPAAGIPPPPSAGPILDDEEPEAEPPHNAELDLSGVPVLAREPLERGADLVRIRPGSPLEVLSGGHWTEQGKVLAPGAVAEAAATARRALELNDDALSGEGYAGDAFLEFLLPPLTDRAFITARTAARQPADVDRAALRQARQAVQGGAGLLVVGPWPEPALAALAEHFESSYARTRVLSFANADWWIPAGWPVLDPHHPGAVQEALRTGELFLDQPPEPILEAVTRTLPRPGGGTVLAMRQHSLIGALEQLARQTEAVQSTATPGSPREDVAALFPLALTFGSGGWSLVVPGVDSRGQWTAEPAFDQTSR
jgi:pSer/pThr/pTyr-binding forkhead associated (FHA) protein